MWEEKAFYDYVESQQSFRNFQRILQVYLEKMISYIHSIINIC